MAEQDAAWGKDLFARDPDQCCAMRKVAPLGKALAPYAAWASGAAAQRLGPALRDPGRLLGRQAEVDQGRADRHWTDEDLADYVETQRPVINPLLEEGYQSIGCEPCTPKVDGPDARAGRWAGLAKTECGIHL